MFVSFLTLQKFINLVLFISYLHINQQKNSIKKLTVISLLMAMAYLCTFMFKFKVGFLTFDFKDAFLSIIAFLYGPLYAVISAVIVAFFELISISETGIYGFLMNSISSVAFAATCGIIYRYKHNFSGAVLGSIVAVFVMTIVMAFANLFITPYYMNVSRSDVAQLIPTLLLPFNFIKGCVNAGILWIIYKPITTVFKKAGLIKSSSATNKTKFGIMTIISIVVITICVLLIYFWLNGSFSTFLDGMIK